MKQEKHPTENTPQEATAKRIVINVERYQHLLEALDDRVKVRRIAASIFGIGVLLFTALTIIMLSLKSFFPYSDISTSAFGTTTITDEQKEVSYFLFNTADLWANSGISVKKGDVISIHSSGSANTAIHHIDESSRDNTKALDRNFGPLGERKEIENTRDILRSKFRIFPNYPQSALIMQVVQNDSVYDTPKNGDSRNFYYVGAQRENIHIAEDGVLHFAINDIVLNTETIRKMMIENIKTMAEVSKNNNLGRLYKSVQDAPTVDSIQSLVAHFVKNPKKAQLYDQFMTNDSTLQFGGYMHAKYDSTKIKHLTEMDYYHKQKYKQAWYDDNVGSFLIVVDKDNSNRF